MIDPLPPLTIQMCTYDRPRIIREVLGALFEYFIYPGDVTLHINDDHSPGLYRTELKKWLFKRSPWPFAVQTTGKQNSLLGVSMNKGLQTIEDDYIFFIEDDFQLTRSLDVSPGVALLANVPAVGMVRYSGLLGHQVTADLREADISNYLPTFKQGAMWSDAKVSYWVLSQQSNGHYIYSNRPHLKHRRFHEFYGLYPENLSLGQTEEWMAHNVRERMIEENAPQIAALPEWVCNPFECIQTQSYQHSEVDRA